MTTTNSPKKESTEQEFVITRILDAPRELVFKSWTEPERVMLWWGPKHFTTPVCRIDLHPGGEYFNCMRSPEGQEFWSKGVFLEIVVPERLVMTDSFADKEGNIVPASHYGMSGDWPLEMLVTVTFEEQEGKTKLSLRHSGLDGVNATDRSNMQQGWNESFDKLADALKSFLRESTTTKTNLVAEPGRQEIVVTRIFDAPRELVFKAYTDPDRIPQWWGPRYLATTVEKMDVRRGGVWRFVQRSPDGNEYAFNGVFHEVMPPERLVSTFEFEGAPGHVSLETATFEEHDGRTKFTGKSVFQAVEDRDEMLKSGMEEGMAETMDRLAELLAKLQTSTDSQIGRKKVASDTSMSPDGIGETSNAAR